MACKVFAIATFFYCFYPTDANAARKAFRTVALAGSQSSGNAIEELGIPSLNDAGHVAFHAELYEASNRTSLIAQRFDGILSVVAKSGDMGPSAGTFIDGVSGVLLPVAPQLNNSGQVTFATSLFGAGVDSTNREAVLRYNNSLELIAPGAGPVPGAGVGFRFVADLQLNDLGRTAFMAPLVGSDIDQSNDFGVFREAASGELIAVAREGSFAPQTSLIFYFPTSARNLWTVALNDRDQTAFAGQLIDLGTDLTFYDAIFSEGGGNGVEIVARSGSLAPGTLNSTEFSGFGIPELNNHGRTLFWARLAGPDVTESNDYGLFRETADGNILLVARDGDPASGMPGNLNFRFNYTVFRETPSFNDDDQAAFIADLIGDSAAGFPNEGVFRTEADGGLELLARSGDILPGQNNGLLLAYFEQLAMNDSGRVAFSARSSRSPSTFSGTHIIAEDNSGEVRTIVSTGDEFDVSNDPTTPDRRTIQSLSFAGDVAWNERGQVAFKAEFTDGTSGVFISNLVAIPEPTNLMIFVVLHLAVMWRPRKAFWA